MNLPLISVLIPTYNRPGIVQETVNRLVKNLRYQGEIEILVGNDGDPISLNDAQVINDPTGSLGANLNRLIKAARGDLLFQMDDDHWLTEPLDLTPHADKLLADDRAGWVRLMGVASHNYKMRMDMTPFSRYILIDWDSPETYITSNRPHLKRRNWHDIFGLYPEGLKLGMTEEGFCHQCRTKAKTLTNPPLVLLPLDVHTESAWQHVGDSWQGKGF